MIKKIVLTLFVFFFCTSYINAADLNIPSPIGYVNDFEGIISNDEELEKKLVDYEKSTGNEVVVVTVKDFSGTYIEDYAVKLFEKWGIGKKDKDNGLLILVSKEQRQSRIEVGYGLEGVLTDAITGRIQDEKMIPSFKNDDYTTGINNGVDTVIQIVGGEVVQGVNESTTNSDILGIIFIILFTILGFIRNPWILGSIFSLLGFALGNWISGTPLGFIFLVIGFVIGFAIGNVLKFLPPGFRNSFVGRTIFSSGGGSSGFGGFGGGHSGGGGSSRSW